RHTRWPRDWSSDVCSSDLTPEVDQVAAGLLELLIDFRSLDNGKHLALLDVCPNIEVPLPQIAICSCIDRRRDEWLHITRKDEVVSGRSLFWRNNRYGGKGCRGCLRVQSGARPDTGPDARYQKGGNREQRNRQGKPSSAWRIPYCHIIQRDSLPADCIFGSYLFSLRQHK